MTQERVHTALRKKAEAGRPAPDSAPMTPERAVSQALAKVAEEQLSLPVQIKSCRETRMSLADLPEALEDLSLLAVIEGPGEGLGLVALPPVTLATLIEVQTMGRLGKGTPPARRPTRIDAAMVAEFIDGVLGAIEESLIEMEAVAWAGGFRYASFLDDPRPLGLLLEDIPYRVWKVSLGLGAGAEREGEFLWAVPAQGRGQRLRRFPGMGASPASEAAQDEAFARAQAEAEWAGKLESTVLGTHVTLDAVLHRATVPLSAVMGFRVGTEIPISMDALERLCLEAVGARKMARARLGQHKGFRAVRLSDEAEEGAEMEAPSLARPHLTPSEFSAGTSPFAGLAAEPHVPSGLGDPHSAAYDLPEGGFPAMDMGGLGGFSDEGAMPMGMALDGFDSAEGAGDLPPLKIGSGL